MANKMGMTAIALAALMTSALAAGQPSVERGKELFYSTALGTNYKSCATCHPEGSKLHDAASYDDKRLVKIINLCIGNMLKGKPLPPDSDDMASLVSYLKSFAAHPPLPATQGE
jgi:cytochrome c